MKSLIELLESKVEEAKKVVYNNIDINTEEEKEVIQSLFTLLDEVRYVKGSIAKNENNNYKAMINFLDEEKDKTLYQNLSSSKNRPYIKLNTELNGEDFYKIFSIDLEVENRFFETMKPLNKILGSIYNLAVYHLRFVVKAELNRIDNYTNKEADRVEVQEYLEKAIIRKLPKYNGSVKLITYVKSFIGQNRQIYIKKYYEERVNTISAYDKEGNERPFSSIDDTESEIFLEELFSHFTSTQADLIKNIIEGNAETNKLGVTYYKLIDFLKENGVDIKNIKANSKIYVDKQKKLTKMKIEEAVKPVNYEDAVNVEVTPELEAELLKKYAL